MGQTDRIPLGLLYQEKRLSYESLVLADQDRPLVFEDLKLDRPHLRKIMEEFE